VLLSQLAKYIERRSRRSPKTAATQAIDLPDTPAVTGQTSI